MLVIKTQILLPWHRLPQQQLQQKMKPPQVRQWLTPQVKEGVLSQKMALRKSRRQVHRRSQKSHWLGLNATILLLRGAWTVSTKKKLIWSRTESTIHLISTSESSSKSVLEHTQAIKSVATVHSQTISATQLTITASIIHHSHRVAALVASPNQLSSSASITDTSTTSLSWTLTSYRSL